MSKEEINGLSEVDFINYIICTICDYAKHNNYQITDTVKTMGENLAFKLIKGKWAKESSQIVVEEYLLYLFGKEKKHKE